MTSSASCVIVSTAVSNQGATFAIADTKRYVQVVTLSTQDNAKLSDQSKSGFKRTINWYKYQSKSTIQAQYEYLGYIIDLSFQGVNRLFVVSCENNPHWTSYNPYFLPTVEIKDYLVMIDGWLTFLIIQ